MSDCSKIHIGNLIKQEVAARGIKVSWLADQLHCHRNNIYKIYEKQWIDTHILMELSKILNHDFFIDLSNYWKDDQNE